MWASLIDHLVKNWPQRRRPWFNSGDGKICWRRDRLPSSVFLGFSCSSTGKEELKNNISSRPKRRNVCDKRHVFQLQTWTCILKSIVLESIPNGKVCPVCTSWWNSTWTLTYITETWSRRSTRILSTGSPTSSRIPGINCMRLTPVNCHTVTSTKPLILFLLQRESLRPDMCSSPWNQDQQHEDDFPGSWLPWPFSLHSHPPSPSHLSWSLITSCVVVLDFWGFK